MVDLPGNMERTSIRDVPKVDLINILISSLSQVQKFSKKEIIEELLRRGARRKNIDDLINFFQRNPDSSLRDLGQEKELREKILERCKPRLI